MQSKLISVALGAALLFAAKASFALACVSGGTLTLYCGENSTPAGVVTGPPKSAHDAFYQNLTNPGVENFSGFTYSGSVLDQVNPATPASSPIAISFPSTSVTATIAGQDSLGDSSIYALKASDSGNGRFDTTNGAADGMLLEGHATFSVTFDSAVSAFGFYATDAGDFGPELTIRLFQTAAATQPSSTHLVSGPQVDGSLLFWGFIDSQATYEKVEFVFGSQRDGIGFDDFTIGSPAPVDGVPEPGTLALLGLALLGAGAARRYRR
jgi:PEP-CTERM motif